jgi:hypothetical protein
VENWWEGGSGGGWTIQEWRNILLWTFIYIKMQQNTHFANKHT